MAFSSLATVNSTWLSNPTLIYFFFPPFIYYSWCCYQKLSVKHFTLACLFLGLLTQAAIFQIYWGLLLLLIVIRHLPRIFPWQQLVAGGATFFATISSIIVGEVLLIRAGVLTSNTLGNFDATPIQADLATAVMRTLNAYGTILARSLFPTLATFSFILVLILGYLYLRQKSTHRDFLCLTLLVPLIFITVLYRNSSFHIFSAVELLIYFMVADLYLAWKNKLAPVVVGIILALFIGSNLYQLWYLRTNKLHYVSIQRGIVLADQLGLIDYTYQAANFGPFTFSAKTNPHDINVTWHYLYSWYGQKKYGYTPTFIGPTQEGRTHYGLIEETTDYSFLYSKHFLILEADTGLDIRLEKEFMDEQARLGGTPSAELDFGDLKLLEYSAPERRP